MKLVDTKCPRCGAAMEVDLEAKQAVCPYCRTVMPVDDAVQRFKLDGAAQSGYEFEKGRQLAQTELNQMTTATPYPSKVQQTVVPKKKNRTWLWVLGWLFIFPVPLTILMLRNKTLAPKVRYGIIAAAWLVFLLIGIFYEGDSASTTNSSGAATPAVTAMAGQQSGDQQGEETVDPNSFELIAGQKSVYGKAVTMIRDAEKTDTFFAYYVPEGYYEVKNLGSSLTQVNVHSGIKKDANGFDVYTGTGDIVTIDRGEIGYINVPKGWFIEIREPSHISLTPNS